MTVESEPINSDGGEEQGSSIATTLFKCLPYLRRHKGDIVVIKYGGHAMGQEHRAKQFAADCVLLKMVGLHPVIVHGGGPQISEMLKRLGVESRFVQGLRVTDADTLQVVQMVLGVINQGIASLITLAGGEGGVRGVGLSGMDAGLFTVEKCTPSGEQAAEADEDIDLGFVGKPKRVDAGLIRTLIDQGENYIPVIAPIGVAEDGQTYNINADTAAGAIAAALGAPRMLLLTDVAGVLDEQGRLIQQMNVEQCSALIGSGVAVGGMIPKLKTAIAAVQSGVGAVVIMDGRQPHAILEELFTESGSGTLIRTA